MSFDALFSIQSQQVAGSWKCQYLCLRFEVERGDMKTISQELTHLIHNLGIAETLLIHTKLNNSFIKVQALHRGALAITIPHRDEPLIINRHEVAETITAYNLAELFDPQPLVSERLSPEGDIVLDDSAMPAVPTSPHGIPNPHNQPLIAKAQAVLQSLPMGKHVENYAFLAPDATIQFELAGATIHISAADDDHFLHIAAVITDASPSRIGRFEKRLEFEHPMIHTRRLDSEAGQHRLLIETTIIGMAFVPVHFTLAFEKLTDVLLMWNELKETL